MVVKSKWQVISASVQGTVHKKHKTPCQDAHAYRHLPEDILVIAVADGAGTAERSAEGSTLATDQAIISIEAKLQKRSPPHSKAGWRSVLRQAFTQARHVIFELAEGEGVSPQLFATTLTCAIVADRWFAVGQIGDGVAIAQAHDGSLFTTLAPQRGEYVNETCFLTMKQALDHVETKVYRQSVQAVAMITDGLIRLAMNIDQNSPHEPFFQPLFNFATQTTNLIEAQQELIDFLNSERVCNRTDDDKTLVLAVCNEHTDQ